MVSPTERSIKHTGQQPAVAGREAIERHAGGGPWEDLAGYCRAVRAGGWVIVSGTSAHGTPETPLAGLDCYEQTREALLTALDAAAQLGAARERVVRTRLLLAPGASWQGASRAHAELFGDSRPANTTMYAGGLIPEGALVEVEIELWVGGSDAG